MSIPNFWWIIHTREHRKKVLGTIIKTIKKVYQNNYIQNKRVSQIIYNLNYIWFEYVAVYTVITILVFATNYCKNFSIDIICSIIVIKVATIYINYVFINYFVYPTITSAVKINSIYKVIDFAQ